MDTRSSKLLIVDDDEFGRSVTSRLLQKEGYSDFDMAENGSIALKKIRENDYDAIMLDVEMPELDGFGVLEELQKDMRHTGYWHVQYLNCRGTHLKRSLLVGWWLFCCFYCPS